MSKFACSVLRAGGHEPMPAFDFMQTLMLAMRVPAPEAILLDLSMPAGTGLNVLEKLKGSFKTSHIPVIVVSGTADDDTRAAVMANGAAVFLAKPVSPEDLSAAITALG
jgi:DNA-binding response OmpR family regulator